MSESVTVLNSLYGAEDNFPRQNGLKPQAFKIFSYNSGGQTIPLKWNQPNGKGSAVDVSYAFDKSGSYAGLSTSKAKELFAKALSIWSQYAPLNFKEIADPGNDRAVDIRVKSQNIDGRGNTLGFAYSPSAGDITFDSSEQWSESLFLETAVHEIGHSLGLDHEPENGEEAIMNPRLIGRYQGNEKPFLLQDDINGIRSLYGSGQGSVKPLSGGNPTPPPAPTPQPPVPEQPVPDFGKNLIVNGSFENSSVRGNSYGFFRQIEGWRTTSGRAIQVDRRTSQYGAAADGGAWIEPDSLGNSTVTQDIDTINGANYKLSFEYSPRADYGADTNGVDVLWNGKKIDTVTAAGKGQNSWKTFSYDVKGTDTSQLSFRGAGKSDNYGGFIDNVALVQPAEVRLGAAGKLGGEYRTGLEEIAASGTNGMFAAASAVCTQINSAVA